MPCYPSTTTLALAIALAAAAANGQILPDRDDANPRDLFNQQPAVTRGTIGDHVRATIPGRTAIPTPTATATEAPCENPTGGSSMTMNIHPNNMQTQCGGVVIPVPGAVGCENATANAIAVFETQFALGCLGQCDSDGDIMTTATSCAPNPVYSSGNVLSITLAWQCCGAVDTRAPTATPTAATVDTRAPTAAPTDTDCCSCVNHQNNTFENPECCIHGDSPNSCADMRWGQSDGTTGSCVWRPPAADECAPTPAPTAATVDTRAPTADHVARTKPPTIAPTAPCEDSVELVPSDNVDPGFTYTPTAGPGVWFDRCPGSNGRCFERKECVGGGGDATTTQAPPPHGECSAFRAFDMATLPTPAIASGATLVNYSNANWGAQTWPILGVGTSSCSTIGATAERGFASHLGAARFTFDQQVTEFYIATLNEQAGDTITTSPAGTVVQMGCATGGIGYYYAITLDTPAAVVEFIDADAGGGSGVSVMLAECNGGEDSTGGQADPDAPAGGAATPRLPDTSLWRTCQREAPCEPSTTSDPAGRCVKHLPCNQSTSGTRSPTGGETRPPTPSPTRPTAETRSPTAAPTAPCDASVTLIPTEVEEPGIRYTPTTGAGVWFERCETNRKCFRERPCNVDRGDELRRDQNLAVNWPELPRSSLFRHCQRPTRCHGSQNADVLDRCVKKLACNATTASTQAPTPAPSRPNRTGSPTSAAPRTKPPTPAPTSAPTAPCEDSVALVPADIDERGVIYTPTTGPGVWFERCEGSPRCFRPRRCNVDVVVRDSASPRDQADADATADWSSLRSDRSLFRFCQRPTPCAGVEHSRSPQRCLKQIPCNQTTGTTRSPTPAPTTPIARTRSPTPAPTRPTVNTQSPTTTAPIDSRTRAPTTAPTESCEDSITMVPTEVNERGVTHEPTDGQGVWFDRCEESARCFEPKRCNGDTRLPVTSLFRTCQREVECTGEEEDAIRGCHCMKQLPCGQTVDRTRPPTPAPTTPAPTPKIIIVGVETVTLETPPRPRPSATLTFELDYATLDKAQFVTAVLDAVQGPASLIAADAIEEVKIHEGSVVVELMFAPGTDSSALASTDDLAVTFDDTTVTAASIEVCEDCAEESSSTAAGSGSGSAEADDSSSADGATVAAGILAAALVVVLAVGIFVQRQRRDSGKEASFDPEQARDPMDRATTAMENSLYETPTPVAHHPTLAAAIEPNGFVLAEDRKSFRVSSVRRQQPLNAASAHLYESADAIGDPSLTQVAES